MNNKHRPYLVIVLCVLLLFWANIIYLRAEIEERGRDIVVLKPTIFIVIEDEPSPPVFSEREEEKLNIEYFSNGHFYIMGNIYILKDDHNEDREDMFL